MYVWQIFSPIVWLAFLIFLIVSLANRNRFYFDKIQHISFVLCLRKLYLSRDIVLILQSPSETLMDSLMYLPSPFYICRTQIPNFVFPVVYGS